MKRGDKIEMTDAGRRALLPLMKKKITTGIFIEYVTQSGDIIRVQRDGLQKRDTTFADYWQPLAGKLMQKKLSARAD